jgi:hypothetical protein
MFDQSCAYDPCFDENQEKCKPKCRSACDACSAQCATACDGCKASCKDDDCKKACATTCGKCRQECVVANDRCASGTCLDSYKECRAKWKDRYQKSKCPGACDKFKACSEACPNDSHYADCSRGCRAKMTTACPGFLLTLCEYGTD